MLCYVHLTEAQYTVTNAIPILQMQELKLRTPIQYAYRLIGLLSGPPHIQAERLQKAMTFILHFSPFALQINANNTKKKKIVEIKTPTNNSSSFPLRR